MTTGAIRPLGGLELTHVLAIAPSPGASIGAAVGSAQSVQGDVSTSSNAVAQGNGPETGFLIEDAASGALASSTSATATSGDPAIAIAIGTKVSSRSAGNHTLARIGGSGVGYFVAGGGLTQNIIQILPDAPIQMGAPPPL